MAVALDQVVWIGDVAVAAVVKRAVCASPFSIPAACGAKDPLAVLVRENGATTAFDIAGARIPLGAFDRRFPGRLAEFERRAIGGDRTI